MTEQPDLVGAAEALQPLVREHADEGERNRRLPMPVVEALRDAGLLRMCVPAAYGGPEASALTLVRAIEAVSIADGAAGWCTMIASTTSSMSLFMDPDWARRVFGDPLSIGGGVFAPNGKGVAVDGGWRVTGHWQWGSGTQHCNWITGGSATDDGGFHLMFFDATDVEILDTWYTSGLRGTGSNEFRVDGAFVPSGRSVQPMVGRRTIECPLSAFPNFSLLAAGVAAVSLGVARHAVDELTELARGKRPAMSSKTISESGAAQADLAKAEGRLRAARALLHDELHQAWETAEAGGRVDIPTRARIRLACTHAAEVAASVADVAYTLGGGVSVFDSSPLQRCLRDAHVATQHMMVSPRMYESIGKLLFGHDTDTSTF